MTLLRTALPGLRYVTLHVCGYVYVCNIYTLLRLNLKPESKRIATAHVCVKATMLCMYCREVVRQCESTLIVKPPAYERGNPPKSCLFPPVILPTEKKGYARTRATENPSGSP
ncbi:hypothetical protein DM02DRAFT_308205 [Periconia macrospinosa]|uniref:Uncharacterized protein n=1 Tax=Periconia macrospinosa TaxID=97972 RepID=A0A2V1DVY6_9PLEO|nr:hypothetical protein DM02DRAFT_308205 [Periconia macrospinosa]